MERICNDTLSRMEKLFGNTPLWAAFIAFVLAQAIKLFTGLLDGKGWNMRMLTTTGGMPSSHSATMAALTVSIAMVEGLGSHLFAISFVASLIIMNDAMNVRYETGKQAEIINKWSELLSEIHKNGAFSPENLKTMIGHSSLQVAAGALLGLITGSVFTYFREFHV